MLLFLIVGSHRSRREGNGNRLGLTRREQIGFPKAAKLLIRFLNRSIRCGIVNLYDFFSGECITNILYGCDNGNVLIICLHVPYFRLEISIAFAIAEAVVRGYVEGVKITVADINAVAVILIVGVTVVVAEIF